METNTNAIIQHLLAMSEEMCEIEILSTVDIGEGAIFVKFQADGELTQTAIYYPSDDILFAPSDWQSGYPATLDEIKDYQWMNSAGDTAVIVNGLPRAFVAIRDEMRKSFGERVRLAREAKGLQQSDLARLAGITQANVSRIESGRYSATLNTISRLSAALGEELI